MTLGQFDSLIIHFTISSFCFSYFKPPSGCLGIFMSPNMSQFVLGTLQRYLHLIFKVVSPVSPDIFPNISLLAQISAHVSEGEERKASFFFFKTLSRQIKGNNMLRGKNKIVNPRIIRGCKILGYSTGSRNILAAFRNWSLVGDCNIPFETLLKSGWPEDSICFNLGPKAEEYKAGYLQGSKDAWEDCVEEFGIKTK